MKKTRLIASLFVAVFAAPLFITQTSLAMAGITSSPLSSFAQAAPAPPAEEEEEEKSCEDSDPEMSWLLCPVLRLLDKFVNFLDNQINSLLRVPNDYFEGESAEGLKATWARMRNIAYLILVPILLIMVIGTALGFDFISAYTVKRALPRLVAAVFFMALSYEISVFLIKLTNDVGSGMLGLLTSSFEVNGDGLADRFDPGGGSGAIFTGILTGGAILAPGAILIILSYAFVIAMSLLVGFLALALRQVILIALIVLGPLAILAWIFPGNDKLWKLWWGSFSKLLLLYPLIATLIGGGRVFASIVDQKEGAGLLETILILTAYIGPYFFIPAMFKFAGGIFGTVAGMANDKSRGLFDRQKKYRQAQYGQKYADMKSQQYYKGNNALSERLNVAGARLGTGVKGRFGLGAGAGAIMSSNARMAGAEEMKTPKWQSVQHDDKVMRAATYATENEAIAGLIAHGESEQDARAIAAKTKGTIGFGKRQQVAAAQQMLLNKTAYDDVRDVAQTISRVSDGNTDIATSLQGFNNAYAKQVGRNDLAGLTAAQAASGEISDQQLTMAMLKGYQSGDTASIVRNNSGGFRQFVDHWETEARTAEQDYIAASNIGDQAGMDRSMQRARAAQTTIEDLRQNKIYATGENKVLIDSLYDNTEGFRGFLTSTPIQYTTNPATGRTTSAPVMNTPPVMPASAQNPDGTMPLTQMDRVQQNTPRPPTRGGFNDPSMQPPPGPDDNAGP